MRQKLWCTLIILMYSFGLHGQAVFAPVKGAEWRYHLVSVVEDPLTSGPPRAPREGVAILRYTLDTVVDGQTFKKLTLTEVFKNRGNDTIRRVERAPWLMTQRRDSVFVLFSGRLNLCYTYKKIPGEVVDLVKIPIARRFNLTFVQSLPITPLNNTITIDRFSYSSAPLLLDIYSEPMVEILDRVGPLNTHITVLRSQYEGDFTAERYRLLCYTDSQVGRLDFSTQWPCNFLTNIQEINQATGLYFAYRDSRLIIKSAGDKFMISHAHVFDTQGRLVGEFSNSNNTVTSETDIFMPLSQGIYFVSVKDRQGIRVSGKIVVIQ